MIIKKQNNNKIAAYKSLYLMLLPSLVLLFMFCYMPMYGILIAFKDFRLSEGILQSPWVGLKYFRQVFLNPVFWNAFKNTCVLGLYRLAICFPAPILLALILSELRDGHFKTFIQTTLYLPHFLSWVILSGVFINLLSPSRGVLNAIIKAIGLNPIYFLGIPKYFKGTLIGTLLWKEIGWSTIIYTAAIAGVNLELFEAAKIDGASRTKRIVFITLPSIMPIVFMMLLFAIAGIINDNFDQIINLQNPTVISVSEVLSTYTYKIGLQNIQYSLSTAIGLFRNAIALMLMIIANISIKKLTGRKIL